MILFFRRNILRQTFVKACTSSVSRKADKNHVQRVISAVKREIENEWWCGLVVVPGLKFEIGLLLQVLRVPKYS